jgi:hypothetical protein
VLSLHVANAAQSVDSTRMHVIVFFKRPQLFACSLGLCLYCNKVFPHVTCENHTRECENHTQRVKITLVRVVYLLVSGLILNFFLNFIYLEFFKFDFDPNRGNPKGF